MLDKDLCINNINTYREDDSFRLDDGNILDTGIALRSSSGEIWCRDIFAYPASKYLNSINAA